MNKCIRHGESMLVPITEAVTGKQVSTYIVAHSETGHHHVLESEAPFTVDEKKMYLELFQPARLVHKKSFDAHKTLPITPGKYKIVQKSEYDPWQQIIRKVWD